MLHVSLLSLSKNTMPKYLFALLILTTTACAQKKPVDERASQIVNQCIEVHGGENYNDMDVSFNFRKFRIHLKQKAGIFLYERTTRDSLNNEIHDMLTNDSFTREINGSKEKLTQKDIDKYKEALNSVAYFALLPYKLKEPAANLKYLGETIIDNKKYDKIAVSFNETGGGKDYKDVFCYWIARAEHTMDYMAYSNGGPRFRKAIKREKVDAVIFQDYENYEIADTTIAVFNYDNSFKEGKVKLLSTIEQSSYSSGKTSKQKQP